MVRAVATAVAGVAHRLVEATVLVQVGAAVTVTVVTVVTVVTAVVAVVVADSAEDLAPRTQVSRAKTLATGNRQFSHALLMHRASVMHRHRESTESNSARTHVARALTLAQTSATPLTNASLPAMSLQAFLHLACLPAAAAGVAVAAIAVVGVAGTSVAAVRVQVAVAAGVILVAGSGVDSIRTH